MNTTHSVHRSVDENDYYAWDVERQDRGTNDEIWIMEFTRHFILRNICFPEKKKSVSDFEFWKKIRNMPHLSFNPNIIGSPTATATPQMINMDPKIALWFPEVWAWEYSIGCLIARYLKFFVQNWDSMTVAKLLEPIFEKNKMLPINTDCHKVKNWGCRTNYVHGHVNVTNNIR